LETFTPTIYASFADTFKAAVIAAVEAYLATNEAALPSLSYTATDKNSFLDSVISSLLAAFMDTIM
jgi:hypothetical protein